MGLMNFMFVEMDRLDVVLIIKCMVEFMVHLMVYIEIVVRLANMRDAW